MTEVKIHGYLSKVCKKNSIKIHLGRLNDVLFALDSIIPSFRNKVIELNSKGFAYAVKKIKNIIHITPILLGSGGNSWMKFLGFVLIVVGILLMPFAPQIGFAMITAGVQILIAAFTKYKNNYNPQGAVGGAVAAVQNNNKSYLFSNMQNLAVQGVIVPIGYGLIKTASKIISVSVKNYKIQDTFAQENFFRFSEPENSTFL